MSPDNSNTPLFLTARAKFWADCKLKAKPSAFGNPSKLTARITASLEQNFNGSFVGLSKLLLQFQNELESGKINYKY